jgi:multimeric flavodoxin WrbA
MKAIVLSAVPPQAAGLSQLAILLNGQLAQARYDEIEHFDVAEAKLGFCQGEFDCWLRHPGRCKIDGRLGARNGARGNRQAATTRRLVSASG